jgi:hypothetical protein
MLTYSLRTFLTCQIYPNLLTEPGTTKYSKLSQKLVIYQQNEALNVYYFQQNLRERDETNQTSC